MQSLLCLTKLGFFFGTAKNSHNNINGTNRNAPEAHLTIYVSSLMLVVKLFEYTRSYNIRILTIGSKQKRPKV